MATISSIFGIKSSHSSKHHSHVLQSASSSTSSMTPLTLPTTSSDDKNFAILKELASLSGNRNCFDCLQRGPTYVNMTIGSFVCTSCSGKLRGLNPPHRVKSISMAVFSDEEIDFLKNRGNDFCQKVWLGRYPGPLLPLEKENDSKLVDILTARYERKCWYVAPSESMHDETRKKTETELNKKNKITPSSKTVQSDQMTPRNSTSSTTQSSRHSSNDQSFHRPPSASQIITNNSSGSKQGTSSLSSSPFVRSPIKTFSPVTPQSITSAESPQFSFQPVTTGFADFANFSSSPTTFSPSNVTPAISTTPQFFPAAGLTHNLSNYPSQSAYYNVPLCQVPGRAGSSAQDKYAPLHDLTRNMDALSINWSGHHVPNGSQNHVWNTGGQFGSNVHNQCPTQSSSNPFIQVDQTATSQISQNAAGNSMFYQGYVQPMANSFGHPIPVSGLNPMCYDNMVYQPVIRDIDNSMMHRFSYQNPSHMGLLYHPQYFYQSLPQYHPSNPFLNQQTETQNRGTNPFL